MCRSIKTLYNFAPPATEDEIMAAALQYVRKVSGFNKPSQANEAIFNAAVEAVAANTRMLLRGLQTNTPPKDRLQVRLKAQERSNRRFGSKPDAAR